jgi:hypothetical protein
MGKLQNYPLPEARSPVTGRPSEMTRRDARQYFDWWVALEPSRLEALRRVAAENDGPTEAMDFTRESLAAVWDWARSFFSYGPAEDDIQEFRPFAFDPGLVARGRRMSQTTLALCLDLCFYLARTMMDADSEISWVLDTQKHVSYQQPVLRGFTVPFWPFGVVHNAILKDLEHDAGGDRLTKIFDDRMSRRVRNG